MLSNDILIAFTAIMIPLLFATLYSQIKKPQRIHAIIILVGWVLVANIVRLINLIVWHDDADIRLPGWGDLSAKLMVGIPIAVTGCNLRIAYHLATIVGGSTTVTLHQGRRERRFFDYVYGIGIPGLAMALHTLFQPDRFAIVSGIGCIGTWVSSFGTTVILIALPPAYAWLYAATRLFIYWYKFKLLMGSGSRSLLPKPEYRKVILYTWINIFVGAPLAVWTSVVQYNKLGSYYDFSWHYFKAFWTSLPILQDYTPTTAGPIEWANLIVAVLVFSCFGCGADAKKHCRKLLGFVFPWHRATPSTARFIPPRPSFRAAASPSSIELATYAEHTVRLERTPDNARAPQESTRKLSAQDEIMEIIAV